MKKDIKLSMQKKLEMKKELEKLSNKSLTVFTVALFCEVILMFLASALNGSGAYRSRIDDFVCIICGLCFGAFVVMIISYFVMKSKNIRSEFGKQWINWSIVTLAVSIGAFLISAPTILTGVFGAFGLDNLGGALAVKMVSFSGTTAAYTIMGIVAVYVIIMFIYYNIQTKKIKKSK